MSLAIAAASSGSLALAVIVRRELSWAIDAVTWLRSWSAVIERPRSLMTASRIGRVVAIVAYVWPSFCDTVSWLMSGFAAVSDWPTTIVASLVYIFGWMKLTTREATT